MAPAAGGYAIKVVLLVLNKTPLSVEKFEFPDAMYALRLRFPANAPAPMDETDEPSVMVVMLLRLKASVPMVVTLLGMVMDVSPAPENAHCWISVTVFGMVNVARPPEF